MAMIMIEVNIPAGRSIAEAKLVVDRHFSDDWVADWWHISDVKDQYEKDQECYDLSDAQCQRVLELMELNKDASVGYNWDYVAECIEAMYEETV